MANTIRFYKVTSLPSQLQPNAVYVVARSDKPQLFDLYVVGTDGTSYRRTINYDDVVSIVNSMLSGLSQIHVVPDIAARNALNPTTNIMVLVLDATGDPTVSSGAATYIYNYSAQQWVKISEWESLDLVLAWNNIQGRPTSSVADIDDAVAKRHAHANLEQLNKVGEDANGIFMYGGQYVRPLWETASW